MTKKEMQRITYQENVLMTLGFTQAEAEQLRRISMTLRRWHELECGIDGGCVERDDTTGKAMWRSSMSGKAWPIADRETGAKKRLAAILTSRNARFGHQIEDSNWKCDDGTFDTVTADGGVRFQNLPADKAVVHAYIQGDPRGAALYILRPGDVPEGKEADAYYSRGICVY